MTDICLSQQLDASTTFGPSTPEVSTEEELAEWLAIPMPKTLLDQKLPRITFDEMKRDFQYDVRLRAYSKAIGV